MKILILYSVLAASIVHGVTSETGVVKSRHARSLNPYQPSSYRSVPANLFGSYYPPANKPYNTRTNSGGYPWQFFPQGLDNAFQYRPPKGVGRPKPPAHGSSSDNFPPGHTFTVTVTRPELPAHLKEAEPTSFTVLEQLAPAPPQFQQIEVSEAKVVHPYAIYPPRYRTRY